MSLVFGSCATQCELMIFFNIDLCFCYETGWKFWWTVLRYSGWAGQIVSEYSRCGDSFRFFGQISSAPRPFSWIFCQNLDFQKFDLYPYNFELSCSHQFLTDNGQFYHFSKGKSVLRCEIWNLCSTIILRYKFC